jgi:hypothetical protein
LTHIQGTSNILIGARTGFAKKEMQYNILYNSSYFFRRGKRGKPIFAKKLLFKRPLKRKFVLYV